MTDQQIRLSAEWQCWPTWTIDADGDLDNPDPHDLVAGPLADELVGWADEFDAIFDADDPSAAAFPSEEAERAFLDRGRTLAQRLADQLGRPVTFRDRDDVVLQPRTESTD